MYITKNSIFRKLSIISLAVLVFFSSLLGSTASTVNAVGVDTVVKLVGGKAVVRALAEEAGMALSKKQVDNVTSYIEKKTFDGDPNAIEFATKANNLTSSGSSLKEGFKKYLLDPSAWLLGLDLIFLAVDAFQDGYDSGESVGLYGVPPIEGLINPCLEAPIPEGGHYWYSYKSSNNYSYMAVYNKPVEITNITSTSISIKPVDQVNTTYYTDYYKSPTASNWTKNSSTNVIAKTGSTTQIVQLLGHGLSGENDTRCEIQPYDYTPIVDDIINVTNVNTDTVNHFYNNTYNTNTTYNVEIELPDSPNYDDTTPWNEPDSNIEKEVNPVPVDSDEDGVPDDTDSDVDKGSWLENLLPIITLIAIFDLLKAVIFYLARMFEFVLTIPLIEAIPIDNVAFEWFRTAEIVGIEIYSVISLLATIGLSFAVYKVVRRLLP